MLPGTQSIQSARLSVQSSALGPPTRSPASECCSLQGGRHTRLRERGWRGPDSDEKVRHSGTPCTNPSTLYTPVVGVSDEPYSAKPAQLSIHAMDGQWTRFQLACTGGPVRLLR
jgi:hypothetical protein